MLGIAETLQQEPWVGEAYCCDGGGLMLWGFSHHRKPDETDSPNFNIDAVTQLVLTDKHWFFTRLKNVCLVVTRWFLEQSRLREHMANAVTDDIYSSGSIEARKIVNREFDASSNSFAPERPCWPSGHTRSLPVERTRAASNLPCGLCGGHAQTHKIASGIVQCRRAISTTRHGRDWLPVRLAAMWTAATRAHHSPTLHADI